ncbi:MAG: TIGR03085 family metal-binding protein [Actinomycetes bacterium]
MSTPDESVTDSESLAARERQALADLFDAVGPDAATLCGGWSTRDLAAHLILRESHPAAVGIVIPQLAGWTSRQQKRIASTPYASIVDRFRHGPPLISPLRLPGAEAAANTFEHFVHHEDVLRAQASWHERDLRPDDQLALWHQLTKRIRLYVRRSPVPVRIQADDMGSVSVGNTDLASAVTLSGTPAELVLYLHGRRDQTRIVVEGSESSLALWHQHTLAV